MTELSIRGKKVSIQNNGQIFVNGKDTKIKQWSSDSSRFSNMSGQELSDIRGQSIEKALMTKGFI